MPQNPTLALDVWHRYQYVRDAGHTAHMKKAAKCEDFFAGVQWDPTDLALLAASKRPALTINKILSTLSNVMGEQIFNRSEIGFRPRSEGASSDTANALNKVYQQISDNNQLPWIRSSVFADGVITGRGFYDVRLDFSDALRGEVRITALNPHNVLIDPDADTYDTESWSDVLHTKWYTADEIEMLYSKKDADLLRSRASASDTYGYDAFDDAGDKFGTTRSVGYSGLNLHTSSAALRNIRVVERQWRKLDKREHFVDLTTGDMRAVPDDMMEDHNLLAAYMERNPNLSITKKLVRRIRWTVVAGDVILHDDWSPYRHFTIVPFFPILRRGRTIGLVENLLGPQELLNKVSSQELHVVNTTANSGWITKTGNVKNMSTGELEQRGAQTGLVIEVDEMDGIEKITPNQVPTGLDRISYKAEEHIKTISGVSDYRQGNAREDVSAKALKANMAASSANLALVTDNLNRTDWMLARSVLACVQDHYTEQRLVRITADDLSAEQEELVVNEMTPEGEILNNLTLGEYDIVVTSTPERDTFEDSQFEQALRLRVEAGIPIPDKHIIMASRLRDKAQMVKEMEEAAQSEEAQAQAELERRGQEAAVAETEAKAAHRQAQAQAAGGEDPQAEMQLKYEDMVAEHEMKMLELQQEMELARERQAAELAMMQEKMQAEIRIKAEQSRQQAAQKLADQNRTRNQQELKNVSPK
jgi:hypothetical protein